MTFPPVLLYSLLVEATFLITGLSSPVSHFYLVYSRVPAPEAYSPISCPTSRNSTARAEPRSLGEKSSFLMVTSVHKDIGYPGR